MTRGYLARLTGVTSAAVVLDQATKSVIRTALTVGEHRHVGLGIGVTRVERTEAGSTTATLIVGGIFVVAGLLGARVYRPSARTWLVGGLLVGGAISSFVELAITGHTTAWLSLPLDAIVSLAYLEMLIGGCGLFFHIAQSRRRPGRTTG